jgi:hypothetical protein
LVGKNLLSRHRKAERHGNAEKEILHFVNLGGFSVVVDDGGSTRGTRRPPVPVFLSYPSSTTSAGAHTRYDIQTMQLCVLLLYRCSVARVLIQ